MKDTKEIILKTAYDMFLRSNYEAVTISSIIKTTGLTKGAIYHYFNSKEELFIAVVNKYMIDNKINIEIEHSSLRDLIAYSINRAKEQIALSFNGDKVMPAQHITLIMAAFRYYPGYADISNKFFSAEVDKWEKVLDAAISKNEIKEDIDTQIMAMNFLVIGTNILANTLLTGSTEYAMEVFEKQLKELYKCIKK
jgi:AcrR family transcriptional regulator